MKKSAKPGPVCGASPSLVLLLSGFPSAYADDAIMLDPALKGYVKVSGVSGNVNSIGSDTLNNLMTLWAEGFRKQYPNVKIQIEGKGSSTAPPALIEGTAQLGPMSRTMKNTEIDSFERKFRYKPTAFPVAIDALAVYVNKDNSVQGLTMTQVDAIFSKTRRRGAPENLDRWGQLGITGEVGNFPISTLWPQLSIRHLWIFQGICAEKRRLQGRGQRAAGLCLRGTGHYRGSSWYRLQRYRLFNIRRASPSVG